MSKKLKKGQPKKPKILIKELARLSRIYGGSAGKDKLSLLRQLKKEIILSPSDLISYHDLLCFLRAYPDNKTIEKSVESELIKLHQRIETYKSITRDSHGNKLINSGMVDTVTKHQFGFEILRHLMNSHSRHLSLDWYANEESINASIYDILPHLISWTENDALDYDEEFDLLNWLTIRKPGNENQALKSLITLFENGDMPQTLIRQFFEKLEMEISWDLNNSKASRTLQRVPTGRKHYHHQPLLKRTSDLRASITKPTKPLKHLSEKEGRKYIQKVNEVLAVRNRELDPLSMANPSEVYITHPGRGLTIVIYGTQPPDRLPLESNFGALLIRNGLPIGYGVAAALFDRVEIAINVFPAFRFGESSFIIDQFFRIFYHHFDSRVFLVRSRQMGDDEPEALNSGAFWFYYKLGFRAVKPKVRALAESEFIKMKARPKYRVPLTTMKRLSKSDVFFHADSAQMESWKELSIINLGYTVSTYFARHHQGNRKKGDQTAALKLSRFLRLKNISRWTSGEQLAFTRLAPLVLSIADLVRWSSKEKDALGKLLRAKGSAKERVFINQCNRHKKFKEALEKLAGKK